MTTTKLLTVFDAAARLALKPSTLRKMISRREIPAVRPTRRAVRIREEDVEALARIGFDAARAARERRPTGARR